MTRDGVKVIIAAGGSGGHIFPAIALGRKLKASDNGNEVLFIGSRRALDRRLYEKEGVQFQLLTANKLPYKPSFDFIPFFVKLLFDIARSFFIIVRYRPDAVAGFGGYVSYPVIAVASVLRIPSVVHEQNAVPGRANKALFRLADRVAISFEETRRSLGPDRDKAVVTGNPIRTEIFRDDRTGGIRRFGLDLNKFTILVIGGSQGARVLNTTFIEALALADPKVKADLQVIHIAGVKDYERALKEYAGAGVDHRVHSFIDRIEEAYAAADLVVTRSGASAIFELAYLGKPMILVPYPFAASHQAENAAVFARDGAAVLLDETGLSGEIFGDAILGLMNDRQRLRDMGSAAKRQSVPDAAGILANEIFKLINDRRKA